MAAPVIVPEPQFCDANGHPYSAGTLETYVRDTTTPKATWADPLQASLNANPITLDAAGRCTLWGDGDYRLVLRDAAGTLIWDQPATTIVSAAMAPVVVAPTIADARRLLGIDDAIAAAVATETARAEAAEAALQTSINNEVARATNAENTLTTNLNAEIARAEAAEANLQSQITALTTGGASHAQIYTAHQQVTTLTVTVPTGMKVKLSVNAYPGATDPAASPVGASYDASGTMTRDGTLLNQFGYISTGDPPPVYPPAPNYPRGLIDDPGAGSHTYTVSYFVHADITAGTGISAWPGNFSNTAYCYILAEFI